MSLWISSSEAAAISKQPFSVDPWPLDKNVPANFLQNIFFKVMYSKQKDYDEQLKLGIMSGCILAPAIWIK